MGERHAGRLRRDERPARPRSRRADRHRSCYAAEDPAEFFAVTSEYFFTARISSTRPIRRYTGASSCSTARTHCNACAACRPSIRTTARRRATRLTAECRYMASTTEYAYNRGLFLARNLWSHP
ncbi:zinc-dependent peptidase [Pseudomonas aeruginosa]